VRARVDARPLDMGLWRTGEEVQDERGGRACGGDKEQFFDRAGALFFSALCGAGDCLFRDRASDLGLGAAPGLVPFFARGGILFSHHADGAYFAEAADGYHVPGVFVFFCEYLSGNYFCLDARLAAVLMGYWCLE